MCSPFFPVSPRKAEGRSERTHATPFRPPRPSCAHLPLGGPVERPNVRIPDSRENLLPRVFVRIAKQVLPVRLTRPKSADPPAGRKSLGVFVFTCEMMFGTGSLCRNCPYGGSLAPACARPLGAPPLPPAFARPSLVSLTPPPRPSSVLSRLLAPSGRPVLRSNRPASRGGATFSGASSTLGGRQTLRPGHVCLPVAGF